MRFLSIKPGEATAKVLRDIEEISRYYKPVRCYVGGSEVSCFDLARELISRGTADHGLTICNERKSACLNVGAGSRLDILELSGVEVYFLVDVADRVRPGDLIAYVVTNKGEVRSVRSEFEGRVLLLHEDPTSKPLKYFVVVTGEGVGADGGG